MTKVVANRQTLEFESDSSSLLTFLEKQKIQPQFQCREGFCGACRCQLKQGEVTYSLEPLAFVRKGEILLCCTKPSTDIEIEFDPQ